MKLHLPKLLLTAVLAACVMANTASAEWDTSNTDTFYMDSTTVVEVSTVGRTPGDSGFFVRTNNNETYVNSSITTLTLGDTHRVNVDGSWDDGTKEFNVLTIDKVVAGGTGTINVALNNSVSVGEVEGTLNVQTAGNTTFNKAATLNDVTIYNGSVTFAGSEGTEYSLQNIYAEDTQVSGQLFTDTITVNAGIKVTAGNVNNGWGLGSLTVNGEMVVTDTLKFGTGNNGDAGNVINGTGSITAGTFDVQNVTQAVLDVAKFNATNLVQGYTNEWGSSLTIKSGEVTFGASKFKNLSVDGGVVSLGATTVEGVLNISGGAVTLGEANLSTGTVNVTGGSLVLNNGLTTAGSGSLSISEGASLTTGATIYHNGSGSVTLNGTIVIDTTDLTKFEMAAAVGEVTYSDGSDGFMTTSGATYYLVKGEATGSATSSGEYVLSYGENGVTFVDSSVTTSEEYFVNTAAAQSTDGTFKYKLNGADAVLNVNGTLSNSRIIMGEGKVAVSAGNTLNIDTAGDNAKALLLSTTGDGTIALGTNVTLTETEATTATGTLSIASGATLSIGAGDSKTASIASFSTVELDGGAIRFENKQDTFHNLTVTAKGGALHFEDMGQVVDSALTTLADTTTLNGDLKFTNKWNVQLQIEKLSGTGNFIIDGNGRNTADSGTISINGVDNYTGTVKITNLATNMKLSVVENLGLNVYVDSFVAEADTKNDLDLTGIGAGNTVTLQGVRACLPSNGTIVADVVISNSADGSKAGLEINDGTSDSTSTFAGDVSGSGNLVFNHASGNYTTKFTGDVSGWTGRLDVANGENNIVFTGDATKINNSEILMRSANKTANITFEHDNAVTVSSDFVRNNGSIDLTLNNSSEEGITFTGDRIAVTNLTLQSGTKAAFTGVNALSVTDLTLAAGTKVSVGTGVSVAAEGAAPALAVTGAATLAGGSEVEGGLDLSSATSLTLNGMDSTVTITGDLTLPGTAISLSGDVLTELTGLTAGGKLDLFDVSGVFTLGDAAIASLTAEDNTLLNAVFSATEITEDYYLGYENGVVYAGKFDAVVPPTPVDPTVPEPTTATLSLLALAALAARRRRR